MYVPCPLEARPFSAKILIVAKQPTSISIDVDQAGARHISGIRTIQAKMLRLPIGDAGPCTVTDANTGNIPEKIWY